MHGPHDGNLPQSFIKHCFDEMVVPGQISHMRIGIMLESIAPSHMQTHVGTSESLEQALTGSEQIRFHFPRARINVFEPDIRRYDFVARIQQSLNNMPTDIAASPGNENSFCHTYRVYQRLTSARNLV